MKKHKVKSHAFCERFLRLVMLGVKVGLCLLNP